MVKSKLTIHAKLIAYKIYFATNTGICSSNLGGGVLSRLKFATYKLQAFQTISHSMLTSTHWFVSNSAQYSDLKIESVYQLANETLQNFLFQPHFYTNPLVSQISTHKSHPST